MLQKPYGVPTETPHTPPSELFYKLYGKQRAAAVAPIRVERSTALALPSSSKSVQNLRRAPPLVWHLWHAYENADGKCVASANVGTVFTCGTRTYVGSLRRLQRSSFTTHTHTHTITHLLPHALVIKF